MKIAFDAKRAFHNSTGLGNYSRDLIRGIDALNEDIEIILMDPKPDKGQRDWMPSGCKLVYPRGVWRKIHPFWRSTQAGRSAQKKGAQIFHGLSNELPTDISKTSLRAVVTIHDLIFETHPHLFPRADAAIYRKKFTSAARRADRVVCVSEYTRKLICDLYRIPKAKTSVIYQSCHPSFFELDSIGKRPMEKPYFLMVGRIEERKNHALSLRALARLKDSDVQLVIIGNSTPYTSKVTQMISDLDLDDRVHMHEGVPLTELQNYYQHALALIYPSQTEGFGIPILESFLAGSPVITNKEGVFDEAGGMEALYIDINRPDELTQKMELVLADFDREGTIESAQKRIRENFSPQAQAKKYAALYRQILS